MSGLKMDDIKLGIMDRLIQAGYSPEQQSCRVKWSKDSADCAWISKHVIRTTINGEASTIIRGFVGAPNGSAAELQQDKFDSWYTDGYRSSDTAAV